MNLIKIDKKNNTIVICGLEIKISIEEEIMNAVINSSTDDSLKKVALSIDEKIAKGETVSQDVIIFRNRIKTRKNI
jgi:hypothetical protein